MWVKCKAHIQQLAQHFGWGQEIRTAWQRELHYLEEDQRRPAESYRDWWPLDKEAMAQAARDLSGEAAGDEQGEVSRHCPRNLKSLWVEAMPRVVMSLEVVV